MRDEIIFVAQILPHYREGVFRYIQQNSPWPARWVTGESSSDGAVLEVPSDALSGTRLVRNRWWRGFLWQAGLFRELWRSRPRAVVFVGDVHYVSTWVMAALLRVFTRSKVLYWTMGWRSPDTGLTRLVRLAFYRLAHGLLLYGNIGREAGLQSGYPAHRMFVIYNGLPEEDQPSSDSARPVIPAVENRKITFGAVSRLNRNKAFPLLVEAVALLNVKGQRARIVLAGSGPEETRIATLASRLCVECHLVGEIYGAEDLQRFYETVDVTVVPGAIGLTAIQSLKYGTPVVTNADLSIQGPEVEAVTPAVGYLVHDASPEGFAKVLEDWAEGVDAATYDRCREEYSSRWSAEASGTLVLDALRAFVDSGKGV